MSWCQVSYNAHVTMLKKKSQIKHVLIYLLTSLYNKNQNKQENDKENDQKWQGPATAQPNTAGQFYCQGESSPDEEC